MKDETTENSVIILHGMGWSVHRISRELNISRKRIRRLLVSNSVLRDTTPENEITPKKKRPSKLDPYKEFIGELLGKYSNITGQRVYEHLKVERPFWYFEQSFLNGREFKDRDDLKDQLRQWLRRVNDVHKHGTTKKRPIDMYIEEHPFLQVLPANHFDTSLVTHKVVNQESCIYREGYQYVVPEKYMYELCPIRITEDHVVIYSPTGEQIVTYPLAEKGRKERYVGVHQKRPQEA